MAQTIRGRVCKYDFISVGQITGTENAVAIGVAAPALLTENTVVAAGAAATPYGLEKYGSVGTTAPNPELVQSGA